METAESGSEDAFKITDLITYAKDEEDAWRPTGINIFQLCKALLDGHADKLSEEVLLQDGPVHIFDVCLQHDMWSIACEMASRGVEGCELQEWHLDPFGQLHSSSYGRCRCIDWDECQYCCWGFPVDQGTWMPDFDAEIEEASEAAWEAVGRMWVRECLRMVSSGEKLPFAVSDGAMARLLDIAILTGNQKEAKELAAKCKVLPLRRWRSIDFIKGGHICLQDVLMAALSAGVCLWNLRAPKIDTEAGHPPSFREAVFLLSSSSPWKQCAGLLRKSPQQTQEPWKPSDWNNLAPYFIDNDTGQLDLEKIHLSMEAGFDLTSIRGKGYGRFGDWDFFPHNQCFSSYTLLDLCILTGHIPAARSVGHQIKLLQVETIDHVLYGRPDAVCEYVYFQTLVDGDDFGDGISIDFASPSSCLLAAGAAAKAALRASFKHHARAIFQTIRDAFAKKNLKNIPASVVDEILAFSVEAPTWIEQLNLWKEVDGWRDSASTPSTQFQDTADTGATKVPSEESALEAHVAQQPGTAETPDIPTIDEKSTDDLLMALQASRDEVPALNIDGVCIFRLTRRAKCIEVNEVLLDPTGPLASLHQRVLDAGCQVNPEGNPLKALFVPCTEQQLVELQNLAAHGYELCQDQHVLALQDDAPVIDQALRSCISKKDRPRLQKLCPRVIPGDSPNSHQAAQSSTDVAPDADNDEGDTNEPMLVPVCGFRTDSSLAYPSYQVQ